jgi:TorA maturation chaperone TorD
MNRERREDTVRLLQVLGDSWLLEPDPTLLERLAALPPLSDSASQASPESLAVSYSELFLTMIPPYASLFLSEDAMLNADAAEEAQRLYVRAGFDIAAEWRAGAADHMGVELHFLAFLLSRASADSSRFLKEHVLIWAPVCCLAVERARVEPLYTGIARLTLDVLLALADELEP